MNSTRKITYGSMLLAILGAVMALDRYVFALAVDELIFLLQAVIIILYACKYTWKDGVYLSFGVAVLTFLFGGLMSYLYCPLAIVGGLVYSYGVIKDWTRTKLLLITIILFVFSEFILTLLVIPLFGQSVEQLYAEMEAIMQASFANLPQGYLPANFIPALLPIVYSLSIVLMGIMEAVLVHLLTVILLRRFRIREIRTMPLKDIRIKPVVGYLLIAPLIVTMFVNRGAAEMNAVQIAMTSVSLVAAISLYVLGIIFISLYGRFVLGRSLVFVAVLLSLFIPIFMLVVIMIGFLYASGPFQRLLERRIGEQS
ncbi:MAG: YybS family protein [Erysipelotrichaceae bacterium]|nr:YybS family protein [Erysipelotrichaceae bacterium]